MQSIEIFMVIVSIRCQSPTALWARTGLIHNDTMRCFSRKQDEEREVGKSSDSKNGAKSGTEVQNLPRRD